MREIRFPAKSLPGPYRNLFLRSANRPAFGGTVPRVPVYKFKVDTSLLGSNVQTEMEHTPCTAISKCRAYRPNTGYARSKNLKITNTQGGDGHGEALMKALKTK